MYQDTTERSASQWTIHNIEALSSSEEGAYLEFKKATEFLNGDQFVKSKLIDELTETVSAFLNADGGTILLGAQTIRASDDRKIEYLKPIVEWQEPETLEARGINLTASQVEEMINNNLSPRPFGVQANTVNVPFGHTQTRVIVVTVPASKMGAHQSLRTHRYYRRIGDTDMPMADYEIKDVNNRRLGPLLSLQLFGVRELGGDFERVAGEPGVTRFHTRSHRNPREGAYDSFFLVITALNSGNGTSHAARFDIGMPTAFSLQYLGPEYGWFDNPGQVSLLGQNTTVFVSPLALSRLYPNSLALSHKYNLHKRVSEERVRWIRRSYQGEAPECHPIWPSGDEGFEVGQLPVRLPVEGPDLKIYWLPWRCFSENMPEIRGVAYIAHEEGIAYVGNLGMNNTAWAGEIEDDKFEQLKQEFGV